MSKQQLTEHLAALRANFTGETKLYAAKPLPERMPHRQQPSPRELCYREALRDAEALVAARV